MASDWRFFYLSFIVGVDDAQMREFGQWVSCPLWYHAPGLRLLAVNEIRNNHWPSSLVQTFKLRISGSEQRTVAINSHPFEGDTRKASRCGSSQVPEPRARAPADTLSGYRWLRIRNDGARPFTRLIIK
jgi:hypothetical protein